MNGEIHNVGTVVNDDNNNNTVIAGIVLGIIAALVVGAGLALIVMIHLRKKKRGEKCLDTFYQPRILAIVIIICKQVLLMYANSALWSVCY